MMNIRHGKDTVARVVEDVGRFMTPAAKDVFASRIPALPWPELELLPARAGTSGMGVKDAAGNMVYLCSPRDPEAEAERQIAAWCERHQPDLTGMVVVLGLAGKWHLRALQRRLLPGGMMVLLEPQPEWLAAQTAVDADIFAGLEPGRLRVIADNSIPALLRRFGEFAADFPSLAWSVFTVPARARWSPAIWTELEAGVNRRFRAEGTNRVTIAMHAHIWFRNAIANLPALFTESPIDPLFNVFEGETALVIAAGPTLDQTLPHLREIASRSLVIAAGAALPCLRRHGIQPHLVVAVDSDPVIARQLDGSEGEKWLFVAPLTVEPELFQRCTGRSFIFTADLVRGVNLWLRDRQMLPDHLRIGGTVAVTAVDLAVRMGCKQIILSGIDLSFGDGNASHAAGAVFGSMPKIPSGLIEVPGNFSPTVRTSRQFAGYVDILSDYFNERQAADPALKVVNATNGGARLGAVAAISPEKVAKMTFPSVHFNCVEYILSHRVNLIAEKDKPNLIKSLHEAGTQFKAIAGIAAESESTLQKASGNMLSEADLESLNQADLRFCENKVGMQLISQMFQTLCLGVSAVGDDSANFIASHSNLYFRLKESAAWAADCLDTTANSLS